MRTIHKLVGTLVVVSMSSLATAATAQTAAESKAADFRALEAEMQQESTNLLSSSPPVDTTAPAEDPVPQATTEQQEIARLTAANLAVQQQLTDLNTMKAQVARLESAVRQFAAGQGFGAPAAMTASARDQGELGAARKPQ